LKAEPPSDLRTRPEQFRSPARSRIDEGEAAAIKRYDLASDTILRKFTPIGRQAPGIAERSEVGRPKLGRHGRREIGRALKAMYEDVVKEGVPPRILQLLDGLDLRGRGDAGSCSA
jgi:hypothetical protein